VSIPEDMRDHAGLIETKVRRATGLRVSIYLAEEAGLDPESGRYSTVCEEHATLVNHETLRDARGWAADPAGWCEDCRDLAQDRKRGLPATEAYRDDPEKARDLYDRGFRPVEAQDLRVGDRVAYRETDPFLNAPRGEVLVARITAVEVDWRYGEVRVEHTSGETSADDGDECWVQRSTDHV
jgi:hypothetical protein